MAPELFANLGQGPTGGVELSGLIDLGEREGDDYGLTPQQVGLLRMLDEPTSMRAFAEDMSCDPSNVTGLVDRAERLGLVERVPDPRATGVSACSP